MEGEIWPFTKLVASLSPDYQELLLVSFVSAALSPRGFAAAGACLTAYAMFWH